MAVESIESIGRHVRIRAASSSPSSSCPRCGATSDRVHSRYERTLGDAAIAGRPTSLRVRVRRFFCDAADCVTRTFAEQIDGLTNRYARRTQLARGMLETIGVALAGRAGARLAATLGLPTSRSTLLRLVRALPDPRVEKVAVLGVDDFAVRRGHVYGTVLLNMSTHQPVDLLEGREADTLADWLDAHPGAEVICRDRAGAYAEGARRGAPDAVQVADRWHLWHNLAEAVEKTVAAHRADLREPEPSTDGNAGSDDDDGDSASVDADRNADGDTDAAGQDTTHTATTPPENRLVTRTRERYAAVQDLLARGEKIAAICRQLNLDRKTVQRFARADDVEQLLGKARSRGSLLDPFKPYLHERFNAGCTDAAQLTTEITERGYRGSDKTVRRYLHPFRENLVAPPATPVPPTVRQVTGWLTRDPDALDEHDTLALKQIRARSAVLDTTYEHVRDFAKILTNLQGDRLPDWMTKIDQEGAPALKSFVKGLRTDLDAVTAGLTLPYSSGAVEGTVNKIKMIKRQMFGRAKFDLLRKRILTRAA